MVLFRIPKWPLATFMLWKIRLGLVSKFCKAQDVVDYIFVTTLFQYSFKFKFHKLWNFQMYLGLSNAFSMPTVELFCLFWLPSNPCEMFNVWLDFTHGSIDFFTYQNQSINEQEIVKLQQQVPYKWSLTKCKFCIKIHSWSKIMFQWRF